ncbi:Germinal-center associated nuclear protein [Bonamia ostreae]
MHQYIPLMRFYLLRKMVKTKNCSVEEFKDVGFFGSIDETINFVNENNVSVIGNQILKNDFVSNNKKYELRPKPNKFWTNTQKTQFLDFFISKFSLSQIIFSSDKCNTENEFFAFIKEPTPFKESQNFKLLPNLTKFNEKDYIENLDDEKDFLSKFNENKKIRKTEISKNLKITNRKRKNEFDVLSNVKKFSADNILNEKSENLKLKFSNKKIDNKVKSQDFIQKAKIFTKFSNFVYKNDENFNKNNNNLNDIGDKLNKNDEKINENGVKNTETKKYLKIKKTKFYENVKILRKNRTKFYSKILKFCKNNKKFVNENGGLFLKEKFGVLFCGRRNLSNKRIGKICRYFLTENSFLISSNEENSQNRNDHNFAMSIKFDHDNYNQNLIVFSPLIRTKKRIKRLIESIFDRFDKNQYQSLIRIHIIICLNTKIKKIDKKKIRLKLLKFSQKISIGFLDISNFNFIEQFHLSLFKSLKPIFRKKFSSENDFLTTQQKIAKNLIKLQILNLNNKVKNLFNSEKTQNFENLAKTFNQSLAETLRKTNIFLAKPKYFHFKAKMNQNFVFVNRKSAKMAKFYLANFFLSKIDYFDLKKLLQILEKAIIPFRLNGNFQKIDLIFMLELADRFLLQIYPNKNMKNFLYKKLREKLKTIFLMDDLKLFIYFFKFARKEKIDFSDQIDEKIIFDEQSFLLNVTKNNLPFQIFTECTSIHKKTFEQLNLAKFRDLAKMYCCFVEFAKIAMTFLQKQFSKLFSDKNFEKSVIKNNLSDFSDKLENYILTNAENNGNFEDFCDFWMAFIGEKICFDCGFGDL